MYKRKQEGRSTMDYMLYKYFLINILLAKSTWINILCRPFLVTLKVFAFCVFVSFQGTNGKYFIRLIKICKW